MAKNTRWSPDDMKKKGLIQNERGDFIPVSRVTSFGKVDKLPGLGVGPIANKKIMNATKSVVDGVKFDSNLEKYMYWLLQGSGITFEFQYEYLLQEKFRYGTEAIRAITLTVDFLLPSKNMIIDTKGYMNDVAPLKHKLLKKHLYDLDPHYLPRIELPSNRKECDLLMNRILFEK